MRQRKNRNVIYISVISAALVSGVAAFAATCWNDSRFIPSGDTQELWKNQVVFAGDKSMLADSEQESEKEAWEKDENAGNREQPQGNVPSGYLFEQKHALLPEGTDILNSGDHTGTPKPPDSNPGSGSVYDRVDSSEGADAVVGDQNGGNGGGSSGTPSAPGQNPLPEPDKKPDPVPPTQEETEDPDPLPEDGILDPAPTKNHGDYVERGGKPYTEENVKDITVEKVVIEADREGEYRLYKGQSVTGKELYCLLLTYTVGSDNCIYYWDENAYKKYVRIDGVSFDGGNSYQKDFPVTIPEKLTGGQMKIKVGYRLSLAQQDWLEQQVPCEPEDSRNYVLSELRDPDSGVIDVSKVLNMGAGSQCLKEGAVLNLYRWLGSYVDRGELKELLPGWMEDGKLIPWLYPVTTGRHILEPAKPVPLEEGYREKVNVYYMSEGQDFGTGEGYQEPCYLQTFTGYTGDGRSFSTEELYVPRYTQAIDAEGELTQADTIYVPDTVCYINGTSENLWIYNSRKVDEGNAWYTDEDGVLFNKEKTVIEAAPLMEEKLMVPEQVETVRLTENNSKLSEICLEAAAPEQLPRIDCSVLKDCRIRMKDSLICDFVEKNYSTIDGSDIKLVSEENGTCYTIQDRALVSGDGKLMKAVGGSQTLTLSDSIRSIETGAFAGNADVDTLILSENRTPILRMDCFLGGNVKKILCHTQKQVIGIEIQLVFTGESGIEVSLLDGSTGGAGYLTEE